MLYLHGLKPFIVKSKPKRGIYNVDLNDLYLVYPEEDFSFHFPVSLKQISIKASGALDFRKNIMGRSSLFRIISNKNDLDLTQRVIEELSLKGIVAYCDEPLNFRDNDPMLPETPKVLARNKYDSPIILNGTLEALSDYKEVFLIVLNFIKSFFAVFGPIPGKLSIINCNCSFGFNVLFLTFNETSFDCRFARMSINFAVSF